MIDEKTLEELAIEERRAYNREWKRKNPDKVRAERERYWRNRALKRLEEKLQTPKMRPINQTEVEAVRNDAAADQPTGQKAVDA